MTLWEPAVSDPRSEEVRRWVPPDVTLSDQIAVAPPQTVPGPTEDELIAIRRAAQEIGAKAGYEAGYLEGYQKGYEEGRAAAEREALEEQRAREERDQRLCEEHEKTLKEAVGALEGVARDLADPLASMVDSLEPELLALTGAVARRVVMAELATTPDLIRGVLIRALNQLPSRNHAVRVRVHPREQDILAAHATLCGESITWQADPEIERGGCVVESGPSRIDATLEARLRQAIDAIWGELTQPVPFEESGELGQGDTLCQVLDAERADDLAVGTGPLEPPTEAGLAGALRDESNPASVPDSIEDAMHVEPVTMAADVERLEVPQVLDEALPVNAGCRPEEET